MPSYIITFKHSAPDSEIQKAKDNIIEQGGSIDNEFTLIKGFSATIPENTVSTMDSNPHIENIERDGEMRTQ